MYLSELLNAKLDCPYCHSRFSAMFKTPSTKACFHCFPCSESLFLYDYSIDVNLVYLAKHISISCTQYLISYCHDNYYYIQDLKSSFDKKVSVPIFDLNFANKQEILDQIKSILLFT